MTSEPARPHGGPVSLESPRPAGTCLPDGADADALGDDRRLAAVVQEAIRRGRADFVRSFEQLARLVPELQAIGLADRLNDQLRSHPGQPFSPWLILSYYRIGSHLGAGGDASALPVSGQDLLAQLAAPPPAGTVLAFADPDPIPPRQWEAMLALFQEGGDFVADLSGPEPDDYVPLAAGITEARNLLRGATPELVELMDQLQPLVVLARPGPLAREAGRAFGGATTFFFRGGSVVNADPDHTLATLLEVLIHEYAHAELFVLAQEQHLCLNDDQDRHPVRIRQDPRPMNGILHALHVSSRVAASFERVLAQGLPWRSDRGALLADLAALRDNAISNGRSCLEAVLRHGQLTPLGTAVTRAAALRLHA